MNKFMTAIAAIVWLGLSADCGQTKADGPWLLDVDHRQLVSRADLVYQRPAARPVDGQPIGNGRMGTMVWTSPGAIEFQINRVDVFAVNRNHRGIRSGGADYCGGCARVTVEVGGAPFEAGETFRQSVSLYDAECTIAGNKVSVRCFVSAAADVLVLEVDDQRAAPQALRVKVSMLRQPEVKNGEHVARSSFSDVADRVVLAQRFQERDHDNSSAVAAMILGEGVTVEAPSAQERVLVAPAVAGKRLMLITSAADWGPGADVDTAATSILAGMAARSVDELRGEHVAWWSQFWSRTFVHLASADGVAEFMERIRTLQLYCMASSSRGTLPPKWNGSIFAVANDARSWGAQFWVWTTEISYFPLHAADAGELVDPWFEMYVKHLPAAKEAARQRWGAEGAYFLEAGPFDGPVVLPDEIAKEYQEVYLGRKTVKDLSAAARALGQYECVLTQFADGHSFRGVAGRYSFVSHIASSGSEIAAQAWWRYRYTGDRQWLRSHAYPLLRETVEFYRSLTRKGADGRYHLTVGLNQHEGGYGTHDGLLDLASIRSTAPLAIRAAEILGVDEELRAKWDEFLKNLVPYPMSSDPRTYGVVKDCKIDVWASGVPGDVPHDRFVGEHHENILWPVFPCEDWTLESGNPEVDRIVQTLAELNMFYRGLASGSLDTMSSALRTPIMAARIGLRESLPTVLANHYRVYAPLPNGFSLFEGATDHSIEHLGGISTALNEALLQSLSPRPGEPEVIRVFPACPPSWDAAYRLLARGGFLVSSAIRKGNVDLVEIESRRGETCRLRNPWGKPCQVQQVDGPSRQLAGEVLEFETKPGARYRVLPQGASLPARRQIQTPPTGKPWSYRITLASGKQAKGTVGLAGVPGVFRNVTADNTSGASSPWSERSANSPADNLWTELAPGWTDKTSHGVLIAYPGELPPLLTTRVSGLVEGTYDVYVRYAGFSGDANWGAIEAALHGQPLRRFTQADGENLGTWGPIGDQVLQAKLGTVTGTSIALDVQRATDGVSWGTGYWGIAYRKVGEAADVNR